MPSSWNPHVLLSRYGAVVRLRPYGDPAPGADIYSVDFEVYEAWQASFGANEGSYTLLALDDPGPDSVVALQRGEGSRCHPDPLPPLADGLLDFDAAQLFMRGNVKWDGCSNVTFDEGSYHFCSVNGVRRMGKILAEVQAMACAMMGRDDGDEMFPDLPAVLERDRAEEGHHDGR